MTDRPADTRTMGIVHSALRRDLARIRTVLGSPPYPAEQQRRAIAAHAVWMMQFLHHHHTGEDLGLWPAVRGRNPAAGELLDQMDADHRAIGPGIAALESAARRYAADAAAREEVLAAVATLETTLLPHLRREELEMMPVVSRTLTDLEYDDIEQKYFVRTKSKVELADEGHWMIDNLDEDSRRVILGVVSPPLRFVLLHGFGPRYRRKRRRMWGDGPAAAIPSLRVDAPAAG